MKRKVINVMMGLLVAVVFGMTGCGSGGDNGGGVSSSYKGNNIQTTVTASNAKAVSVNAVQGVQNVATVGVLGKSGADTPETSPQIQSIAKFLEESVIRVSSKCISPKVVVAKTAAATAQGTEYGYSGSFNYSVNGNDSTGTFSGTITFNSYEAYSYAPTISGNVSFSGVANTSTSAIISINMSISNLQGVIGSQSYTLNGSIDLSSTGTTKTLNISAVQLDNTNNNTYWMKDFSFVFNSNRMTISGTYYDHVYGYVVISTVTPLTVSAYSSTPTSGQLLFTGNNGTKARLTYTYSGYTLEVDANGNNEYVVIP